MRTFLIVALTLLMATGLFVATAAENVNESVTVTVSVQKDASLTWGAPSGTFILPSPDGEKGFVWAPLAVAANSDITLTVYEGLSNWLRAESGVTWDGIWGGVLDSTGTYVWGPGINITTKAAAGAWTSGGGGPVFINAEGRDTIPGAAGKGNYAHLDLVRGAAIPTISGGVSGIIFDGSYEFGVWLECGTSTQVIGGVDWTSIGASTTGTFDLYAIITNL